MATRQKLRRERTIIQRLIDLLLLRSRMRRLPFTGWTVVTYGMSIGFALLGGNTVEYSAQYEAALALALMGIAIKFPIVSARLHDINVAALCGLPTLILVAIGMYNHYLIDFLDFPDLPYFYVPAFGSASELTIGEVIGIILLIAIPLTDIILMIVPGNRSRNRFGPPPGKDDTTVAEQF